MKDSYLRYKLRIRKLNLTSIVGSVEALSSWNHLIKEILVESQSCQCAENIVAAEFSHRQTDSFGRIATKHWFGFQLRWTKPPEVHRFRRFWVEIERSVIGRK